MSKALLTFFLILVSALSGCSTGNRTPVSIGNPVPKHDNRFDPLYTSERELIETALTFLAAGDTAGLHRVRASMWEFEDFLWPEFPMSKPEMNVPEGFAWGNLDIKSDKGARKALRACSGKTFEYISHEFTGPEEQYTNFVVRQGTRVKVRDREGRESALDFFGSIVEMNGSAKLMSYRE